jgi:hypothetical protein
VKLPTAVAITSTLNPSNFGQAVTFNAKVSSSGGGAPSGSVIFWNGGTKLGTVTLDASENASFTTSTLSVGSHSITVSYGGNTIYFTSTSPVLSQKVN